MDAYTLQYDVHCISWQVGMSTTCTLFTLLILSVAQAIPNAFYGQGTGPIVLDDLACTGNENRILACKSSQFLSISSTCDHYDDAGVKCEG